MMRWWRSVLVPFQLVVPKHSATRELDSTRPAKFFRAFHQVGTALGLVVSMSCVLGVATVGAAASEASDAAAQLHALFKA